MSAEGHGNSRLGSNSAGQSPCRKQPHGGMIARVFAPMQQLPNRNQMPSAERRSWRPAMGWLWRSLIAPEAERRPA